MTIPNPISELLTALDNDPQLEEALRQRILTRELLDLPQKVAELADTVARMAETFDRRLTTLEERVDDVAGQQATTNERLDGIESQQATTNERLDGIESQQATTNERLDGIESQQAATSERLDGIESQQATTGERLDGIEGRLDGIESQQATTGERLDGIEGRLDGIEAEQRIMRGHLSNLNGSDYERKVVRRASRLVGRHLGVRNAAVLVAINRPDGDTIASLLNAGTDRGLITEDDADELDRADIILRGSSPEGEDVYVVGEISITIDNSDVDRARTRAVILRRTSATTTYAAVIGTSISDANRERAGNNDVAIIIQNE